MELFSEEQFFLKTIYNFCKLQNDHYYKSEIPSLTEFVNEVIVEAFEDKEYRIALYAQNLINFS